MSTVDNYVQKTRQWSRADYEIKLRPPEALPVNRPPVEGVIAFWVLHVDETRHFAEARAKGLNPVGSLGISFGVEVSADTGEVLREYGFQ